MDDLFTYMERQTSAPPEGVPPGVATLFERLSMQVHHAGHERYSADAILHRIRWHMQIERGDREFCINNNWSSQLARWFLDQHPELKQRKFFETRERRKDAMKTITDALRDHCEQCL